MLSGVSADCYEISTSLSSISVGLSSEISSVSSEVSSIPGDIEYLSSTLSMLNGRYDSAFETKKISDSLSVELMKIADKEGHIQGKLVFDYGTLVLVKND